MKTYSPEIEADIAKRSKVFGIVLGLVCIPFSFLGGVLEACCPLGSFVGVISAVLGGSLYGAAGADRGGGVGGAASGAATSISLH